MDISDIYIYVNMAYIFRCTSLGHGPKGPGLSHANQLVAAGRVTSGTWGQLPCCSGCQRGRHTMTGDRRPASKTMQFAGLYLLCLVPLLLGARARAGLLVLGLVLVDESTDSSAQSS